MSSEPDLAAAAALVAEPARAELVLAVVADGRLTASELAARAGIARSTASGHLSRLVEGGFLVVVARGRNRYYELAGADVAEAAREVVVAGARFPQEFVAGCLPKRARRPLRSDARERLDRLGHVGSGQLVVAVPALGHDHEEPALHQPA